MMRSVWKRSLAIVLLTLVTAWTLCVCARMGRVVQLNNYIFAKDGSHRWQRTHDAQLVDQVIGEGH
jgi:hypothetical protein